MLPRFSKGLRGLVVVTLICAGVALSTPLWRERYGFSKICQKCARIHVLLQWRLRGSEVTLLTTKTIEEDTELSRCLANLQLIPKHDHAWIFISGGGDSSIEQHGLGVEIAAAAEFPKVRKAIEAAHWFGEWNCRDQLIRRVLSVQFRPFELTSAIDSLPSGAFTNPVAFRQWAVKAGLPVTNRVGTRE